MIFYHLDRTKNTAGKILEHLRKDTTFKLKLMQNDVKTQIKNANKIFQKTREKNSF